MAEPILMVVEDAVDFRMFRAYISDNCGPEFE
jgi:hypothetical protein